MKFEEENEENLEQVKSDEFLEEILEETQEENLEESEDIIEEEQLEEIEEVAEEIIETEDLIEEIEIEEEAEEAVEEVEETIETVEAGEVVEELEDNKEEKEQETSEEVEEPSKEYKVVKEEKSERKKVSIAVATVTIVSLVIIIMLFSTVFALVNLGNDQMIDGVTISGVQLVGLNREDAKIEVEEAIMAQLEKSILLKYKEFETSISPEQIEIKYDIEKAVDTAYGIGRNSNIVKNNFDILFSMMFGKDVSPEVSYNDKALTEMIEDISKKIPGSVKENSFYIEGEVLIITKGTPGIAVKTKETKQLILSQILNFDSKFIELPVENKIPGPINIDEIYQEVHKEPKDAYFVETPTFKIYPHEDGVDFDISLEEARLLIQEDKPEYEIPLKFTKPAIPIEKLGAEAFPHQLSVFSTKYDALNTNRSTNLLLASNKIDGIVLLPGEEFSYNKVVGERTISAGYKEAAMYAAGEIVDGLGGGICQISSTLYNVAVQANLEIVQRSNHQFLTSYVGAGKDATVVYGVIDFKFKNSRNYPIKILSSVKNGVAQMEIYGIKEDVEFDVKIETEIISTISYGTTYVEDPTLDAGVETVKQYGMTGYKSVAYKVCRFNGVIVSREVLSNDTYSAMNKIVRRGTKGAQPVQQTTPPPAPTPPPTPPPAPVTNTVTTTNTTTNTVNTTP